MQINLKRYQDAEITGMPSNGMAGIFHVELIHAATGLIKQKWSFPNVITTAGLDSLMATSSGNTLETLLTWMGVGTNNTTPAITDTALGAQVGVRVNATGGVADTEANNLTGAEWFSLRKTREFATSEGNGNLTELGLFSASSGGVMWCRALFKDNVGTAITVTKTSSDILRVTYEFRIYPGTGDVTQSGLVISGTTYSITWRPVTRTLWLISQWSAFLQGQNFTGLQKLGTASSLLTRLGTTFGYGTELAATSGSISSWNSSTRIQTRQAIWNPASGAITAATIAISTGVQNNGERSSYQGVISPAINKTGSNQLTLNYTLQYDRVTP